MKARKSLLTAFGFSQSMGIVLPAQAQNSFSDDLCQVNQEDEAACDDNGCFDQGGRCTPMQGQRPDGQEAQGCICESDRPGGQELCQVVEDHQNPGQRFCIDLMCPPMQEYNCDPVECRCPAPNEYGQKLCEPDQVDPTQCIDTGCGPVFGGICTPTQVQLPDGTDQLTCHCDMPGPGQVDCEIVINHTTGVPVCADFNCGSMALYECEPNSCDCLCDPAIPPEVRGLEFVTKEMFHWIPTPCGRVYNAYRTQPTLVDCGGGVACTYGTCLWSGLVATNATDLVVPGKNDVQYYLVTAENVLAEGPMGRTSSLAPRPNLSACPSPPPP